jgi:23S rRNA (pseudouridine1915-N3)-methyltransferase
VKRLDFLFVGKVREPHYHALESAYLAKIQNHVRAQILLVKDNAAADLAQRVQKETAALAAKLAPGDAVIVCAANGRAYDSCAFSQQVTKWRESAQRVIFVVGGAYGVTAEFAAVHDILSLAPFTLPHELARVVLLEQVYRALTLLAGSGYHH